MSGTVEIGCVNIQDVRNVPKVRLAFVLHTEEGADVRFLDVTRVLEINSSVQHTEVASDVSLMPATNQLLEVPNCAPPMEEGVDVVLMAVTNPHNHRRSFA